MNDLPNWIRFIPIILAMIFGICMPFAIFIVAIVFINRRKKNVAKNFEILAEALGGQLHRSSLNGLPIATGRFTIEGHYHGLPYQLQYRGGSKYTTPHLTLVVPIVPLFTLTLRNENLDTKLSKQIGMASELEIGLPEFDNEYFIQTNDPTHCRKFLRVPEHRAAIDNIRHSKFTMAFTRQQIQLTKPVATAFSDEKSVADATEIQHLLDDLHVLATGLKRLSGEV